MKLYFYRGEVANFGDDLNEWLMPKVFPDFFDDDADVLFLGIGSILFNHHAQDARKVVFGSGYGGYTDLPKIDHKWKIYCLRGPLTADALGLDRNLVAGDAAILIRKFCDAIVSSSPTLVSFIPHFQSVGRGHWREVCWLTGINFIDPRAPVADVIRQIKASKLVITEAMHGAIVADALRVPWLPILPFDKTHHFKWLDWAEALGVRLLRHSIMPSSFHEFLVARRGREIFRLATASKGLKTCLKFVDAPLTAMAAVALHEVARKEPCLSSDSALAAASARLEESADKVRRDYRIG